MARDKYAFYDFGAGLNYRDPRPNQNELASCKNIKWKGDALYRRSGYAKRNASLETAIRVQHAAASAIKIVGTHYYVWGSTKKLFTFVSMDNSGGTTVDKLAILHAAGLPSSASAAFTCLAAAEALPFIATDPFSVEQKGSALFLAIGDNDPYVVHLNTAGTAFLTTELILNELNNTAGSNGWAGKHIIPNANWDNAQWFQSVDALLYLSDKKYLYFGIESETGDNPAGAPNGTAAAQRTAIALAWKPTRYKVLNGNAGLKNHVNYKEYLIMGGQGGIYRWLNRDWVAGDWYMDHLLAEPQYGEICVNPNGFFWVCDDGIYWHNGSTTVNISLKIWDTIKAAHTSWPDGLDDVSVCYHDGWVWFSFPNSTNKDIYVLNPNGIYEGNDGNFYGPFFRYEYKVTNQATKKGFYHLRSWEGKLFADDGETIFQLETGNVDNAGAAQIGIADQWYTAPLDFESPHLKKVYGTFTLECSPNLETDLTHVVSFYRDYGEEYDQVSVIDTTYTGAQRAHVEIGMDYECDGNAVQARITGTPLIGTALSAKTVKYFGFSIEAAMKQKSKVEQS